MLTSEKSYSFTRQIGLFVLVMFIAFSWLMIKGVYAQILTRSNAKVKATRTMSATGNVSVQSVETRLEVEDAYGTPGSTDNPMNISLDNDMSVYGAQFNVEFDGELLTAVDVHSTERSSHMTIVDNIQPNYVVVLIYSATGDFIAPGSGPIVTVLFNVNSSAPYGDSTLVHLENAKLSDENGDPISVITENGWFHFGQPSRLWVEDAWGPPGTTDNPMDIGLKNEMNVYGVQFTAEFDGTLLTATDAKTTTRTSHMTIGSSILPNSIKVLVYSPEGGFISPDSGAIVQLIFDVDESAPLGDSTLVHLKEALLADENGDPISVITEDGWFEFFGMKGDINMDGEVDIFDLIILINRGILPPIPELTPYEFWAADINDDGELNIFDVVKIIIIILEGEPTTLAKMCNSPAYHGELNLPDVALIPKQATEAPIYATFDGTVAGVQLVLRYDPQPLKVLAPVLTSRTDQMELASVNQDGKLTILIYSASGNVIEAGSEPIVNLRVEALSGFNGATRLEVDNAIAVNGKAEAISVNFSTGNIATAKPQSYSLSQNYPNPFNPATTIKFELPQDVKVTLKVYNLRGEEVRNLIDQNVIAGYHTVTWDGRDNAGNNVAAGIYIYRMKAGSFTSFRKMAFLK